MRVHLLAIAVTTLVVASGVAPAAAQDATPAAGGGLEIVPLAQVQTSDLPAAPAFIGLVRFSFPPGAATPPGADQGSVLAVIESGDFSATLDGPAVVGRGPTAATPAATPREEFALGSGDTVFVPAGTSSSFQNAGQADATLLAAMIFPADPFGAVAETTIGEVAVEVLAGGMVDSLPSPASLVLAQGTIGPGSELPASAAPGPALGVITAGTLVYTLTGGESDVSRGARNVGSGRPAAAPAEVGGDILLAAGDAFIEETGAVSNLRNTGDAAAALLVVYLFPPAGATATPAG